MRSGLTYNTAIRAISIALVSVPIVVSLFTGTWENLPSTICAAAYAASSVLLCAPVARQNKRDALFCALAFIPVTVVPALFHLGKPLVMVLSTLCLLGHLAVISVRKFGLVRNLFVENAVWMAVEEYVKLCFVALTLGLGLSSLAFLETCILAWVLAILLFLLYAALYYKAYTGRTLLLGKARETKIKDIARISIQHRFNTDDENELTKLKTVYQRCVGILEKDKPFLNPNFSLNELAVLAYCNRSYLSRAVNSFSGVNFRQFINRCRIDYALTLIEQDPHLKVSELSVMSGFNTPVSFSMAFKLNVGTQPSDYIKARAAEHLKDPSKKKEEER